MKESSLQNLDTPPTLYTRKRMLFLGGGFLLLLGITVSVIRQPTVLSLFATSAPPQEQHATEEERADAELMTVAALAVEETTVGRFRSGGLGLTRTGWEVLHGKPESPGVETIVYQDNTYKVTYQQNLVWQIEKSWGTTSPVPKQARARIRRYLPLDSRLTETITTSDDMIVDVYQSHMLAQLLSPQPEEPITKKKGKRKPKELPTESCIVVHRIIKQKVTSSFLHIGPPKPDGYSLPQSPTAPATTTAGKSPTRNEARKEPSPSGKSKVQGKS